MIKILPLKKSNVKVEPFLRLIVVLGYGEHCDDTFTTSWIEIDDEKAIKYESLSDKDIEKIDWLEVRKISDCITQKEAEDIVNFINSLWRRKDKDGYVVEHIVINEGIDSYWWKDQAAMTDKEFEWFSHVYEKFNTRLFNPQVEHNWCGITDCRIEYVDENGDVHQCDVI